MKFVQLITASLVLSLLLIGNSDKSFAAGKKKTPLADPVLTAEGFLSYHPDLRWRLEAVRALQENRIEHVASNLRRAARYGDKPSQAMLAELYQEGRGVEKDPVQAYIWMDLAAERGWTYLFAKREHYWSQLSPEQQAQALELGVAVFAEYGDAVAKPRLESMLKRGRKTTTGSRTGFVGHIEIQLPTENGILKISGDKYYNEEYWKPEKYWAWHQENWSEPRTGSVTVGDVEDTQDDTKSKKRR